MADFGGFMHFTYGGTQLRLRGKIRTKSMDRSYSAVNNQDGSLDRTVKPEGPEFDVDFVDTDDGSPLPTSYDWSSIVAGGPYEMSLVEDSTNIVHTITNGLFIGDAQSDRETGAVTGLKIKGPRGSYQQMQG